MNFNLNTLYSKDRLLIMHRNSSNQVCMTTMTTANFEFPCSELSASRLCTKDPYVIMSGPFISLPTTPEIVTEENGNVRVWWFSGDFSQSIMGGQYLGSNACTLVILLVAQQCHQKSIKILYNANHVICQAIVDVLGQSIMEGNEIYKTMVDKGLLHHASLTVPEAIEAAGPKMKSIFEWKSLVYLLDLKESLFESLNESVSEWLTDPPPQRKSDLYVVLIAENRSVLFIFQHDTEKITLVDTHQHSNQGAVIAQCELGNLYNLCAWYNIIMESYYNARPNFYELSFLYFKKHPCELTHV